MIDDQIVKCSHKDGGFMGVTHATSVLAVALAIVAFLPEFLGKYLLVTGLIVTILFVMTSIGAGNIPDLDNTASRAKSDLGIFGGLLSTVFRASSKTIQVLIKTKYDDPDPNPHRGFWHTIPAALLMGFGVYSLTLISFEITLPVFEERTVGWLVALLVSTILIHLNLSTLAKHAMDKIKKNEIIGDVLAILISYAIAFYLFLNLPADTSFIWLGVSVAFGMLIHVAGDLLTTAGVPVFFPIKIKGKFWYNVRILPIKAGGAFEKYVFMPFFIIIIIISISYMIFF